METPVASDTNQLRVRARDWYKCDRCRRLHKKCIWMPEFSTCERCQNAEKVCGGRVRVRLRLKQTTAAPTMSPSSPVDTLNTPQSFQSPLGEPFLSPRSNSTPSPTAIRENERRDGSLMTSVCAASQCLMGICIDDCQRHLLKPFQGTETCSWHLIAAVESFISKSMQELKVLWHAGSCLSSLLHRCQSRGSVMPEINIDTIPGPHEPIELASVLLACTAQVSSRLSGQDHQPESKEADQLLYNDAHRPSWKDYKITEKIINTVFEKELGPFANREVAHYCFPATHIAFLNKDHHAVKELWAQFPNSRHEKDVLGRHLFHVLIEHGEWELLANLAETDDRAITNVGQDRRGMCLLAIAAVRGNSDHFTLLRDRGVFPRVKRSLLDFALIGGNKRLVEQVVRSPPMVNQPYPWEILKAIELRREDLARCFFNRADFNKCQYGKDEIQQLANQAYQAGMEGLAQDLMGTDVIRGTRQETLTDLNMWDAHNTEVYIAPAQTEDTTEHDSLRLPLQAYHNSLPLRQTQDPSFDHLPSSSSVPSHGAYQCWVQNYDYHAT